MFKKLENKFNIFSVLKDYPNLAQMFTKRFFSNFIEEASWKTNKKITLAKLVEESLYLSKLSLDLEAKTIKQKKAIRKIKIQKEKIDRVFNVLVKCVEQEGVNQKRFRSKLKLYISKSRKVSSVVYKEML